LSSGTRPATKPRRAALGSAGAAASASSGAPISDMPAAAADAASGRRKEYGCTCLIQACSVPRRQTTQKHNCTRRAHKAGTHKAGTLVPKGRALRQLKMAEQGSRKLGSNNVIQRVPVGPKARRRARAVRRGGVRLERGGRRAAARLVEERAGALQHQLQLHQLVVAARQALRVAVGLQQLALQLLQLALRAARSAR
jgi:hypothetical protein